MIIETLTVGPLETNCYILGCSETGDAAVIDPGGEGKKILSRLAALKFTLKWIIDTHGHGDHIVANGTLKKAFPAARLAVHAADAESLLDPDLNLSNAFGFAVTSPPADVLLRDGDEVTVGKSKFTVIHVPGHTPGGIALYAPSAATDKPPVVFSGDALFAGSVGRADLSGGDFDQLIEAIRRRLLSLPENTVVYPGHGEPTTIGREAISNPFVGTT